MTGSEAIRQAFLQQDDPASCDYGKVQVVANTLLKQNGVKKLVDRKAIATLRSQILIKYNTKKFTTELLEKDCASCAKWMNGYRVKGKRSKVSKLQRVKGALSESMNKNNSYVMSVDWEDKAKQSGYLDTDTIDVLISTKEFIDNVGGMELAQQAMDAYKKLVSL